jgi:hypothetical protein
MKDYEDISGTYVFETMPSQTCDTLNKSAEILNLIKRPFNKILEVFHVF